MPEIEKSYFLNRSERGIFVEIYFPKRAAYYGAIFNALRYGYDENTVKEYLRTNVEKLLTEFKNISDLLHPHRYSKTTLSAPPTREQALERIGMYKSTFKGWSVYSVDGVWFSDDPEEKGKPVEEATQIVRIMFRFESSFIQQAADDNCLDVLRAMLFWAVPQRGRLYEHKLWGKVEQAQFMALHKPWPKRKLLFAKQYFKAIVKEVGKFLDDRALFVFGYLIRNFWKQVVEEKLKEDEIWITGFFDLVVNVVKEHKPLS